MNKYLLQNLIAIDQLSNTLLGGYADETLSSRAYRADKNGKIFGKITRPLIDFIFKLFGYPNHCYQAFISECNKQHLPAEFRN